MEGGNTRTKFCSSLDFKLSVTPEILAPRTSPEPYLGQMENNPSVNLLRFPSPSDVACVTSKTCRESPKNFLSRKAHESTDQGSRHKTSGPSLPVSLGRHFSSGKDEVRWQNI